MSAKEQVNVVSIGHVDHGKSTLMGRTMWETGDIPRHIIDKYREESKERGKIGFEFAYVMDKLGDERERGITIEVTHVKFETPNKIIVNIDAPGHRDFVKNMIQGTTEADAAILLVSANDGVMEQTMEHAVLAKTMGVEQLVVVVNKMDMVDYDKGIFDERVEEIKETLKRFYWDVDKVKFIPVSALKGDNVTERSQNLGWWKGDTFIEGLDKLSSTSKPTHKPFRMPIDDIFKKRGVGTIVCGVIASGTVKVGQKVIIGPIGETVEIRSIEAYHNDVDKANAGDDVGMALKGIGKDVIKKGYVLGEKEKPPINVRRFSGRIQIVNHPTGISVGYTPVLHAHTEQVPCLLEKFKVKLDELGKPVSKNPQFLKTNDGAIATMKPIKPMVLEESTGITKMSRFAIRDMGMTVGAGMVVKITAITCPRCGGEATRKTETGIFSCDNEKCHNYETEINIYGQKK